MLDLSQYWYRRSLHWLTALLVPFTWAFGFLVALRRGLYRAHLFKTYDFAVPVIVVGNLTVGGTGKTPFVIELVKLLQSQGYSPGIVSRGCGGEQQRTPYRVELTSNTRKVGDEAILLVRQTGCPMVIGIDRVAAVRELLQQCVCNVIVSDDGLQHYRLGRAVEIVMVDGIRGFGNHYLLPAGPLREPVKRLEEVDFVITTSGHPLQNEINMTVVPDKLVSLKNQFKIDLRQFKNRKVHAVAGIGHPERFFATLRQAGLDIIPHIFPDHYHYEANDLDFLDTYPIVMTEKDAVKCEALANDRYWYLTVMTSIDQSFEKQLLLKLQSWEKRDELKKKPATYAIDNNVQHDDICK
jgi:tetraacyldisaccharide 4'-kinase